MKRLYLAALIFLAFSFAGGAQTYLMDNFKPSEAKGYTSYAGKVDINGGLDWRGGFVLADKGQVRFDLNGQYESLRFVLGHKRKWNIYGDSIFDKKPTVVTVWADDVKVYDGLVRYDGVPEHVTVRINGAKSLIFRIVDGPGVVAFGEVTLWKNGQTPRQLNNLLTGKPGQIELVKDMRPYLAEGFYCAGVGEKRGYEELKSIKINGVSYDYGMMADMRQALSGDNPGKANFYLRKQYSKLSFIAGPVDNKSHGSGWITVKADGKIIYESEIRHDDTAKQVVLPVEGCDMLSFQTVNEKGNMYCGFAKIMLYPEGNAVEESFPKGYETLAPADPRLKSLPDVTKLVSQVKPYAIGSDLEKQLYDGASDYITFSMGGTKYSEGFILYEKANFMDDNIASYAVFDLGNEFDYLRFTAGFVGKSWVMQNDWLCVYADDELILMEPLKATSHPKEYILPIRKCRTLKFQNMGQGQFHGVSAYGIADAVVYRGEDTSVNPFQHPKPDFPYMTDLLDLGMPYFHYVAQYKEDQDLIIHDGSTMRKYFELDGQRIYKGFALKTSINFSLDAGPLSSGSNAAAAGMAGAVAAGVAVVPVAAVGNAMIGSTLAGAAGLLLLAAGGTQVNNSCAAFNLYGEYNSVTFTVACEKPDIGNMPSDYTETLMIGVNGKVVQTMTVYEKMEPTRVTVPIEGCHQLMFWLSNTNNDWSGKYIFYDIEVTKDRLAADIPKNVRISDPVITRIPWDSPSRLAMEWTRPKSSGERNVDKYLNEVTSLYNQLNNCLKMSEIKYDVHTYFLETNAGQVCKAVRLMTDEAGNKVAYPARSIPNEFRVTVRELDEIRRLRASLVDINMDKANAALGLPALGLGSIAYGKVFKAANTILKHCTETLKIMEQQKAAEVDFLKRVLDNAVDIDSKMSTEKTVFCPVFGDEAVPEGDKMMVDVFHLPEND